MPETPDPAADERRTRPFADVLRELDKGRVHTELSTKLQDLIAAVMDVRKDGSITLTLKIGSTKTGEMVEVAANVTTKIPRAARTSIFFVDDEHNLSRNNPQQPPLPLAGLPGGADDSAGPAQRSAR